MRADAAATAYIKKCDRYQRQPPILRVSAQDLTTITSPGPLLNGGLIQLDRCLLPQLKKSYCWLPPTNSANEAFTSIKDKDVVQFMWKNIVFRFGIPQSIVTDNGPQFDSEVYRNFFHELKIKKLYSNP